MPRGFCLDTTILLHRAQDRRLHEGEALGSLFIRMASSSTPKNSNQQCSAACSSCSDNRPDLIFQNFPVDEKLKRIWNQKVTPIDSKFASHLTLLLVKRTSGCIIDHALLNGRICCDEDTADPQDDLYENSIFLLNVHVHMKLENNASQ